jgi:dolichol-phosphate mannosyltransferase
MAPRNRLRRCRISLVVPVHNEQENLVELHRRVRAVFEGAGLDFELWFVDDGSTDATPAILEELSADDDRVRVLTLSRNFGHQAAVSAGLDHADGAAVVVLDGDLQDPPEVIPELVAAWRAGYDVVYAVRRRRAEPLPKRLAYALFYRLLRAVSELEIPLDSGDFSLLDRRVVAVLRHLPERLRFVRGLRSFVGFRQMGVPYDRPARSGGSSKYGFRALCRLAVDGLVSFSGAPLRLVAYAGLAVAVLAVGLSGWVLSDALWHQSAPRGWASTVIVVLFLGAAQMLSLGIVGAYVQRIFLEVKGRPTYIVQKRRGGRRLGVVAAAPPRRRSA